MKKMTRIAALLAAAVLTLCLTACGGGQAGGALGGFGADVFGEGVTVDQLGGHGRT